MIRYLRGYLYSLIFFGFSHSKARVYATLARQCYVQTIHGFVKETPTI